MESSLLIGRRDILVIGSAQRLAASMESSPFPRCARWANPTVLNALRHQWNPHKQDMGYVEGLITVLNALRHQWNPHFQRTERPCASCWCSTPCGINGILTAWVLTCW